MTTLVVGANGATGRRLVEQLLDRGEPVKAVVRRPDSMPPEIGNRGELSVVPTTLLDLDDAELARLVEGCSAVASCLGHNMTFRGIYGPPRRLVTDATRRLCEAVRKHGSGRPARFVLMSTTGNRNRDLDERISFAERCVLGLLRLLLPPHVDNEQAAEYLRTGIGKDDAGIEWVAVRPDTLVDGAEVSGYEVYPSPIRSAIFDAGETSRINVAHFMATLITDGEAWNEWKGRMPVIYNRKGAAHGNPTDSPA